MQAQTAAWVDGIDMNILRERLNNQIRTDLQLVNVLYENLRSVNLPTKLLGELSVSFQS